MAVGALVGAAVVAGVLGFLVGAGVDVEEDFGTLLVGVGVVLVLALVFFWDSVSFWASSFGLSVGVGDAFFVSSFFSEVFDSCFLSEVVTVFETSFPESAETGVVPFFLQDSGISVFSSTTVPSLFLQISFLDPITTVSLSASFSASVSETTDTFWVMVITGVALVVYLAPPWVAFGFSFEDKYSANFSAFISTSYFTSYSPTFSKSIPEPLAEMEFTISLS